jgi:hypothetical protein
VNATSRPATDQNPNPTLDEARALLSRSTLLRQFADDASDDEVLTLSYSKIKAQNTWAGAMEKVTNDVVKIKNEKLGWT